MSSLLYQAIKSFQIVFNALTHGPVSRHESRQEFRHLSFVFTTAVSVNIFYNGRDEILQYGDCSTVYMEG
jgi:hypothetical protein